MGTRDENDELPGTGFTEEMIDKPDSNMSDSQSNSAETETNLVPVDNRDLTDAEIDAIEIGSTDFQRLSLDNQCLVISKQKHISHIIRNDTILAGTRNQIIDETTDTYINSLDIDNLASPEEIAAELTKEMQNSLMFANILRRIDKNKGEKRFNLPDTLYFDQIASLMAKLYPLARISCAGESADTEYDLLALYMEDGPDKGTYVTSEDEIYKIAIQFNRRLSQKEFEEILQRLKAIVPRKTRCMDRDLIAVNNGIFNFETKVLESFTPEIVFMVKSHVDYNPNATNVVIHNDDDGTDWDVESWVNDLSDDPEIVNLLWEIMSAIIRPHVRWNKSAWFYSESGNNGKGTLCELMRQLCGDTAYATIPLSQFGDRFALEPLIRSTAIIVDENDVGTYVDKAANLKAVITNDVISIDRKGKIIIHYQFYGFMVQCLNEFPRIKDKSDSFYRRQLFVPFTKCFTGKERKYIKDDYLHRPEVLEYVLYKVLNMNFYTLSEPQACVNVLNEYKEFNDPVRQFFEEVQDLFTWDLLPFSFLYELYKQWFRKNSPTGSVQGKNKFINEIVNIANAGDKWYCMDKSKTLRVGDKMNKPELLIAQYDVQEWQNKQYPGQDINKICMPQLSDYYRGLLRYNVSDASDDATIISDGGADNADNN